MMGARRFDSTYTVIHPAAQQLIPLLLCGPSYPPALAFLNRSDFSKEAGPFRSSGFIS